MVLRLCCLIGTEVWERMTAGREDMCRCCCCSHWKCAGEGWVVMVVGLEH